MKNKHLILFTLLSLFLYPVASYSDWSAMTSGTTSPLNGVWGSSGSDVFTVGGSGTILHYNGSVWSAMTSGTTSTLYGVWGSSGTDVFAVGSGGTILHYDGSTWSSMTSGTTSTLHGVWGSSGTDVFAVGSGGTILHYDGSTWSAMSSGSTHGFRGVWGSSGSDVFAVGSIWVPDNDYSICPIFHYDGINDWYITTTSTAENYFFSGIWGSSGSDVFAVGYYVYNGLFTYGTVFHYDGITWSAMPSVTTHPLNGVWGSSSSDVFAVGSNGIIIHYAGTFQQTTTTVPPTTSISTTTTVPPTVVTLNDFDTIPGNEIVTLTWSTASEIENAGFNLYRSTSVNGEYIKINDSLIPAKGSATQGASYEFIDTDVQNRKTYYYKLEDIDLDGKSTMHGPVSATPRLIYGLGK